MLEMYREVSLLPTSLMTRLIDDQNIEQILATESQEIALNERVDQLVNEERARSRNAFCQLLEAIEKKRMRYCAIARSAR